MSFFSDVERDMVIVARTELADGVIAFDLASPNGRDLPAWAPGSHVDVTVPMPESAPAMERQYSLCGDTANRSSWRIAVLREDAGGGGSLRMHEHAAVGQRVRVRGPRNHFPFEVTTHTTYSFIAGGIGITPLLAMIAEAEAQGAPWHLHYAGRSRRTMAFLDTLTTAYADRVSVYAADEGARLDLEALGASTTETTEVFACGPKRMIDALEETLAEAMRTRPDTALHVERFEAKEFGEPVWAESFDVELALSGDVVTVQPTQSILDAIAEQSPETMVLSSCRRGTCGTCEVPVIEGEIEHRDSILTPLEQEESLVMMPCVSRAACDRIVLDL